MIACFKGGQYALKQLMVPQGFVHGVGNVKGQQEDTGIERVLSEKLKHQVFML